MSKITIDRALLEQALEWVEAQPEPRMLRAAKIITSLREALAQPKQEPAAKVQVKMTGANAGIATMIYEIYDPRREPLKPGDKLYTFPQEQGEKQ